MKWAIIIIKIVTVTQDSDCVAKYLIVTSLISGTWLNPKHTNAKQKQDDY